jgi:flagellar hook assembly protein FlgD
MGNALAGYNSRTFITHQKTMKNLLRNSLAKKVILFAFVIGLVSPSAMAYRDGGYPIGTSPVSPRGPVDEGRLVAAVAPSVQNLNVTTTTGSATVSFSLNTSATTTVWIKDTTDTIVKTLIFDNALTSGQTYSYNWNGTDNYGAKVASGSYKAQVVAYNAASSDIENFSFNFSAEAAATAPAVSVSVNPTSFKPSLGEYTTATYSLNTTATLRVQVKQGSTLVRTLRAESEQTAGNYQLIWNGRNADNQLVTPGSYAVEVYASNAGGTDTRSATVTVASNDPVVTAPNVSNLYASPTPFNPNVENTRVYFNLDKTADVSVTILDGSNTIRTLVTGESLTAGTYYYEWNGRNASGYVVSDKVYTARVNASNSAGSDSESTSVEVKTSGSGQTCDLITGHYVNPTTFDPEERDAQVNYNLARSASVTVRIKDGSTVVRTILNGQTQNSGQNYVSWNGRESDGDYADDGSYTYEIRAYVSGCAEDVETGTVRVDRDGDDDGYENDWPSTDENLIRDVVVRNEIFDPRNGERSTIEFELTRRADLKVEVLDGRTVVKVLRNADDQASGEYSYSWDGRDSDGDRVRDALYQYRIMADDGDDSDTDRAYVEVDTDGIIIGFPESDRCAGYRDVSIYSPFCKAITLMSDRGIFEGYSDGTFRPYASINRAETVKVVTLALGYNVNTGGTYRNGYTDTSDSAWYAPYLYTAKREGIATGYPDGSFRPGSTINRVELLRVFLEGNKTDLYTCNNQPFDDTPITSDTRWYMKYACYAKDHGLMNSEYSNKLYPAEAMTRGDVADLFYDFEVKGLYSSFVRSRMYDTKYSSSSSDNRYYCVEYDSRGNCIDYESNDNYYNDRYCVEYDRYGNCEEYAYTTGYNDYDRYEYGDDGYYVYRDGRYVWMPY